MTTVRGGVDSSTTPIHLPDEVLSVPRGTRPAAPTPAGGGGGGGGAGGGHFDGGGVGGAGGGGWTLAGWHVAADTHVTAGQRLATFTHTPTGAVAYVTAPAAGTLVGPFGPPGGALVPGSPLPRNVDARTVVGRLRPCAHAVAFEGLCALCGADVADEQVADTPQDVDGALRSTLEGGAGRGEGGGVDRPSGSHGEVGVRGGGGMGMPEIGRAHV